MTFLNDLYQEVILDHNRRPRNYGELDDPNGQAQGYNPFCGDRVNVAIRKKNGAIEDVKFTGSGCAISTASASIMTEVLKGKSEEEARQLCQKFLDMVTGKREVDSEGDDDLEKLLVFHRLSEYPVRVKCATLVWHALLAALESKNREVTTEDI